MDLYCHAQIVPWIVWFCESVCGNGWGVRILWRDICILLCYDTWPRVAWYADGSVSGNLPYLYIKRDGDKRFAWKFCAYRLKYTASCPWRLENSFGIAKRTANFTQEDWSLSEIWSDMSIDTDVLLWVKESLIKCCSLELHIVAARFILMVVGCDWTVNNFDKRTVPQCGDVTMLLASLASWGSVECPQQRVTTRAVWYYDNDDDDSSSNNNNNNNNNDNNLVLQFISCVLRCWINS
jgi:hypothetical protein